MSLSSALSGKGFHVVHTTRVVLDAPCPECSLHLVHDLPPHVYVDPYELAQRPGFTFTLEGSSDLELPVFAVDPAGSVLLLTVDVPSKNTTELSVNVPLHARYGTPVADSGSPYETIPLKEPLGFWACPATGEHHAPPDALAPYIPEDAFKDSILTVIPHNASSSPVQLTIPVGRVADLAFVDIGTFGTMLFMFLYLATVALRTARRLHTPRPKTE
ncbi:hypothetical protein OBBRIDRAFT_809924 [Obba rivulosa]|uniref:Protein PBN1 n=1 Tax=Obba rivulosa TaxID=1052685 RepID=A0A8E2DSY0_9APHY|nr:hypothetical protein OBBRIDRAFT_809924 [Obba rivulosa]